MEFIKVSDEKSALTVESLAREIWREHYTPIIGPQQVEYMLTKLQSKTAILNQIKNEGFIYYLLKAQNSWVGYTAIIPRADELFLSKLYIKAEHRNKGYGKLTIDFHEKTARKMGLTLIRLVVNKKNIKTIKAYLKSGFKIYDDVITQIGEGYVMDDHRMEKILL